MFKENKLISKNQHDIKYTAPVQKKTLKSIRYKNAGAFKEFRIGNFNNLIRKYK